MKLDKEDMSDLMKRIRSAMISIQAQGRKLDDDELRTLMNAHKKNIREVTKQARSSVLDCMQSAMMNIQTKSDSGNYRNRSAIWKFLQNAKTKIQKHWNKQDSDKLRSLLITQKKYNGLNLACILLEQIILNNEDNNVILDENRLHSVH